MVWISTRYGEVAACPDQNFHTGVLSRKIPGNQIENGFQPFIK